MELILIIAAGIILAGIIVAYADVIIAVFACLVLAAPAMFSALYIIADPITGYDPVREIAEIVLACYGAVIVIYGAMLVIILIARVADWIRS